MRIIKLRIFSIIPLISEAIALLFLPAQIPVHYDMNFQATTYGSKYILLVLGVFVVVFGLFLCWIYEKNKNTEHESIIYKLCAGALLVFNGINLLSIHGSMFNGTDGYGFAVIGGSDGPTAIFLAGKLGDGVSLFGLLGMMLLLIGAVIFLFKKKRQ